jgi:hypothetical protein
VTLLYMRAGMDTTRAQVMQVFGEMRPHHTHILVMQSSVNTQVAVQSLTAVIKVIALDSTGFAGKAL